VQDLGDLTVDACRDPPGCVVQGKSHVPLVDTTAAAAAAATTTTTTTTNTTTTTTAGTTPYASSSPSAGASSGLGIVFATHVGFYSMRDGMETLSVPGDPELEATGRKPCVRAVHACVRACVCARVCARLRARWCPCVLGAAQRGGLVAETGGRLR
jgi:hypothetical protein